jgi:nicotinate phosphoribosyltransferase
MSDDPHAASPSTFLIADGDLGLATDLYQLTMAAAYHARAAGGPMPRATFQLSVRRLPAHRNFLVFAGLEQALGALAEVRFGPEQLDYLRRLEVFSHVSDGFFDTLAGFRFGGEVWAMPEGTVFFPEEPLMTVTGTLLEAQIVETLLLSIVNFQVLIASKAARLRLAAGERAQIAEFGGRRAHGPLAAAWAARAAYVGGVDSTSNVFAGFRTGIPLVGTMAHSFVMSFAREIDAFRHYQAVFPGHTIHLVDTYDTLEGVRQAVATGAPFDGVRLDSGDLDALSRGTRRILDEAGRTEARIFASGDLNEHRVAALLDAGAPIDAFGVGTELSTSWDAPALSGIYKLVEVERGDGWEPTFKASAGKATYPGTKQVVREVEDGTMRRDRVVLRAAQDGFPADARLLVPVMRDGEPLDAGAWDLRAARGRCLADLARLPAPLRALDDAPAPYPVVIDPGVEALLAQARAERAG